MAIGKRGFEALNILMSFEFCTYLTRSNGWLYLKWKCSDLTGKSNAIQITCFHGYYTLRYNNQSIWTPHRACNLGQSVSLNAIPAPTSSHFNVKNLYFCNFKTSVSVFWCLRSKTGWFYRPKVNGKMSWCWNSSISAIQYENKVNIYVYITMN